MKKMIKSLSAIRIMLLMSCAISLILFMGLVCVSRILSNSQETQQMAERWKNEGGVSQVSCFFSVNTMITPDYIEEFEHGLDSALTEASIETDSSNANARLWADAYSAEGKITVRSNSGDINVDAMGIGGDFFLFHPLQLLSGSYFSGNDLMQDYCVLDQDAAWKLFGSNNVVGQVVYIGDVAHIVAGVVKHEEGMLYETAGLEGSRIYVSYETLDKYGSHTGINHFEIVMPNPVKEYAFNYVKDAVGVQETELEIVENTDRYSLINRFRHILKLPFRAMNGKAIIYPYWENVARAYEDILAVITIFEILFILYPFLVFAVILRNWWKQKKWTVRGLFVRWKNNIEIKIARKRSENRYKKELKRRKD